MPPKSTNNPIKKECSFKCMAIAVRNFLSPHFRASFQVTKKIVEIEKSEAKLTLTTQSFGNDPKVKLRHRNVYSSTVGVCRLYLSAVSLPVHIADDIVTREKVLS